ncbi:4312_t:CDS:2, partial [Funneliformis geosporum]
NLRIADIIKEEGGKVSVKRLAELTGTNEEILGRLLRAVSTKGIFYHHGNGIYSNNRMSSVLRDDHPNSVLLIIETGLEEFFKAANNIGAALKYQNKWDDIDGDVNDNEVKIKELVTPWKKTFGFDLWEYYSLPANKYKLERFNQAMVHANKIIGNGPFIDYDWGLNENSTVVDVGGGNGGSIIKLLSQYKKTKGIILDLPIVIEHTRKVWSENIHKELSDRVEFYPGNFFVDPPPKADVYYLKWILHNWSDTSAIKILKNLRSAISPSDPPTKLVLLEILMDEPIRDYFLTQMDLAMLCVVLGKERTTQEFKKILKKSGWKYVKSVNSRGYISVIEAVPDFDR